MELDPAFLSRLQFAFVISFHINFPAFTIGLAAWLATIEGARLATGNALYRRVFDFWLKVFAVSFGMGVVTGIVMAFQFGTNWSVLAQKTGPIQGPLLGYEAFTAFMLEATFFGVMLLGRERVSPRFYFFACRMVSLGTMFSSFWILANNSWMQVPLGDTTVDGHMGRRGSAQYAKEKFVPGDHQPLHKTHIATERPPFERIALVLQGGGALGAYQGGVYQALAEANLHPDWVAGISIGAINSALIAGSHPEKRVETLREFWETVTTSPAGIPCFPRVKLQDEYAHTIINQLRSFSNLLFGAPGFFKPRQPPPFPYPPLSPTAMSYYDIAPLKATLERLVDFDLINAGAIRFSVGTVNIRSGNFVYFDNATHQIGPHHVMASGSLPSGFPATEIEGEFYWDGGLVSNTPLQWLLDSRPRQDTLVFQLDLWNARGELPRDLIEVELRQKDIRFSSRTRAATDQFKQMQMARRTAAKVLEKLPKDLQQSPEVGMLAELADEKVYNIIQLIYRAKNYEGCSKDYEFSRRTMQEHWKAGYNDAVHTLRHPEVLQRPDRADGVFTFDLAKQDRGAAA